MLRRMHNASIVKEFTLSGLDEIIEYRGILFFLTLLCYCVIIMANVAVLLTIIMDKNLHEPMYILLCNLCINALFWTSGFYPKFLLDLLSHRHTISYSGCLIQAYVIYSSGCIDGAFLAVMAYDRYVAICRPLVYHSVMTKKKVAQLVCFAWLAPLCLGCFGLIFTYTLRLCGSHIHKLYCAFWLVATLSCPATSWETSTMPLNTIAYVILFLYCFQCVYVGCSYVQLVKAIIMSVDSRRKFMKTCVPHLLAMFNLTAACLFDVLFMRYGSSDLSQNLKNFFAITLFTFPTLINPIIYGLTLIQIRNRLLFIFVKNGVFSRRRKREMKMFTRT